MQETKPYVTPPEEREAKLTKASEVVTKAEALLREYCQWVDSVIAFTGVKPRQRGSLSKTITALCNLSCRTNDLKCQFHREDERLKEWLQKEEEIKYKKEVEDKLIAYKNKAVQWLLDRGLKFGSDFTVENAISIAEDIAFDEEKDRAIKDMKDGTGYTEFSGDDSCEDCRGWDGEDHRCDCGNRRVCWQSHDPFSFENPSIYPEAY